MLVSTGERISMSLLCMALAELGVEAASFTGSQVGIITDNDHTRAKILEVKADRLREALAAGRVPVVAGFQGVSIDREITTLGPGRLRRHRGGAGRGARRRRLRDLHRRDRGLHRRPPGGTHRPPDQPDLLRRDARDRGDRGPRPDAAGGGVRPQSQCAAARAFQFHLGARNLGRRGGCRHGRSRRHRGDPRHQRGQGDGERTAGPPRRGRQAVPGPGRPVDQHRHDRAERLGQRDDRHLLHRPQDRPGRLGGDGAGHARTSSAPRG